MTDGRRVDDEWNRYIRHVRDLLGRNVGDFRRLISWNDAGAVSMNLAGTEPNESGEQLKVVLDNHGNPNKSRAVLDNIFNADLSKYWYAYKKSRTAPVYYAYGDYFPPVVELTDWEPQDIGDLNRPDALPRVTLNYGSAVDSVTIPGLLHGDCTSKVDFGIGQLYSIRIGSSANAATGGERSVYDFAIYDDTDPRRRRTSYCIRYKSYDPPHMLEPDGAASRLYGTDRAVSGKVERTLINIIEESLRGAIEAFNTRRTEDLRIPESEIMQFDKETFEIQLVVETDIKLPPKSLSDMLAAIHNIATCEIEYYHAQIHGDLHSRNVLVAGANYPHYIDFGMTGEGPVLYDFIKLEIYVLFWNLAPRWRHQSSEYEPALLNESVLTLLSVLSNSEDFFFDPNVARDRLLNHPIWLVNIAQIIGTIRQKSRHVVVDPDNPKDYVLPLFLCAITMLRHTDMDSVRTIDNKEEKAKQEFELPRQGMLMALYATMLHERIIRDKPLSGQS